VLFLLIALIFLQRELDRPALLNVHVLGAAIGLGLLMHLTTAGAAVTLAAWTAWVVWHRTGSFRQAEAVTRTIFRPALIWTMVYARFKVFPA
jgi:Mn2+/Fe2+ NRAMP family transporter